jgi:hypothetical protein
MSRSGSPERLGSSEQHRQAANNIIGSRSKSNKAVIFIDYCYKHLQRDPMRCGSMLIMIEDGDPSSPARFRAELKRQ